MTPEKRKELYLYLYDALDVVAMPSDLDEIERIINPEIFPHKVDLDPVKAEKKVISWTKRILSFKK